jgi:hypothetical protein
MRRTRYAACSIIPPTYRSGGCFTLELTANRQLRTVGRRRASIPHAQTVSPAGPQGLACSNAWILGLASPNSLSLAGLEGAMVHELPVASRPSAEVDFATTIREDGVRVPRRSMRSMMIPVSSSGTEVRMPATFKTAIQSGTARLICEGGWKSKAKCRATKISTENRRRM